MGARLDQSLLSINEDFLRHIEVPLQTRRLNESTSQPKW